MGKNIIIVSILIGTIIPFCVTKIYTFNLGNIKMENQYSPFYLNGTVSDGDTTLQTEFALSFFSPVLGFYSGTSPLDNTIKSGTPSLLNFDDILSMEFAEEGKKGEGKLKLIGDKEVSINSITGLVTDNVRSNEYAVNSLGLAYSVVNDVNSKGFEKSESTLELFKKNLDIKKIFSIEPWEKTKYRNKLKFSSHLYLGEAHSDFSDTSNVGNCSIVNQDSPFWNCQFSLMIINNLNFSLTNPETEKPYEVRFIIESKKIVLPKKFKNLIATDYSLTGSKCYIDKNTKETELLLCNQMTEDDDETIPIKFIDTEETMKITGEIDNENLLSYWGDDVTSAFPTNIYFDDINYIIMPLTVFKKFHVLFDAENNKIKFFSNDKSLLKLIEKKEEEKKDETDNLSYFKNHIFTTILVIAIICLVIGLMVSICCSGKNAPTSIKIEGPVTEDE